MGTDFHSTALGATAVLEEAGCLHSSASSTDVIKDMIEQSHLKKEARLRLVCVFVHVCVLCLRLSQEGGAPASDKTLTYE